MQQLLFGRLIIHITQTYSFWLIMSHHYRIWRRNSINSVGKLKVIYIQYEWYSHSLNILRFIYTLWEKSTFFFFASSFWESGVSLPQRRWLLYLADSQSASAQYAKEVTSLRMCVCKSASDSVPGRTNQRLPTSCLSANRMPPRRERCDLYTELNSFNYTSLDNNIRDKLKTTLQEEAVTSCNNSKAVKPLKVLQFKVRINMKLPFARCIFLNIGNLPAFF